MSAITNLHQQKITNIELSLDEKIFKNVPGDADQLTIVHQTPEFASINKTETNA
jgi:hypothetical protein